MRLLLTATCVLVALLAADRLCLWMESRGWIYWRRRKPDPRGAVLGAVEDVFNPAHVHTVAQRQSEELLIDVAPDAGPAEPGAECRAVEQRRHRYDR
mgnify:CR=1 FL=1